ncbi:hypothetical protein BC830DRAFT_1078317 [Chytriomyces sp. MP71]|nr:hypothetical protein BC830DRAFT_1078317 [Chytriomyces sp. MP71]
MERFFGEQSIPVQSGQGSNKKVTAFLLGISVHLPNRPRNAPAAPLDTTSSDIDSETYITSAQHSLTVAALERDMPLDMEQRLASARSSTETLIITVHPSVSRSEAHSSLLGPFATVEEASTLPWQPSRASTARQLTRRGMLHMNQRQWEGITGDGESSFATVVAGSSGAFLAQRSREESFVDFSVTSADSVHRIPSTDIKEISDCIDIYKSVLLILESRLPICYFLLFLLENGGYEELFFVCEVLTFEQTLFTSLTSQIDASRTIFAKFLAGDKKRHSKLARQSSPAELRRVMDGVHNGARACFAGVQTKAFCSLSFNYVKFRQSPSWRRMELDIGRNLVPSSRLKDKAQSLLCNAVVESQHVHDGVRCGDKIEFVLDEVLAFIRSRLGPCG